MERDINKVLQWMEARGGYALQGEILKKTKKSSRENAAMIETMIQRDEIEEVPCERRGKKYKLLYGAEQCHDVSRTRF